MRILALLVLLLFGFKGYGQEHIIGVVEIKGAKKTKIAFINKIIEVKKGSVLDSTKLQNDITRLRRLPSVSTAYFNVFQSNHGDVQVRYTIEENFTLIPYANLYTSSYEDFALRIGLQEFNFLGRNITLGAFYQHDVYNSYGFNLGAPYLFGSKWGIGINAHNLSTLEPIFFGETSADYKYGNKAIEVLGLHQINFQNRIALGVGFFRENYDYVSGATSPDIPQNFDVDKYMYKLIYDFDGIRYDYHYFSGFRNTFNLQYVNTLDGKLPGFVVGFNDLVYYKRCGFRGNWASRLRLGLATNRDTPFAPFSVDNNVNIRGVGNTIDRGTGTVVLNTEYRHSIIDKDWFVLQGNLFVDAGTWRNPGGTFSDFTNMENIRVYPGIGLRFIHKRIFNAVLRIDYGYGITKEASQGIVFGIGQYF